MVDHQISDQTESKPLNTELETLAPEATAENTDLSLESTLNLQHDAPAAHAAETEAEPDYDAADFAAALANFDREQAADAAAAQSLTAEETIVTGTVVKLTDKHVVVDIGLKSEGLVPLDQVLDHEGKPKFQPGDSI